MKLFPWILILAALDLFSAAAVIYDGSILSFTEVNNRALAFYGQLENKIICLDTHRDYQVEIDLLSKMPVEIEKSNSLEYWQKLKKVYFALESSKEFLKHLLGPQKSFAIDDIREDVKGLHEEIKTLLESEVFPIELNWNRNFYYFSFLVSISIDSEFTRDFKKYCSDRNFIDIDVILNVAFPAYARIPNNKVGLLKFMNGFIAEMDPYVKHLNQAREELGLDKFDLGSIALNYFSKKSFSIINFLDDFYIISFALTFFYIWKPLGSNDATTGSLISALIQSLIETQEIDSQLFLIRNKFSPKFPWNKIDKLLKQSIKWIDFLMLYVFPNPSGWWNANIYISMDPNAHPLKDSLLMIWRRCIKMNVKDIYAMKTDEKLIMSLFKENFDHLNDQKFLGEEILSIKHFDYIYPPLMIRTIKHLMSSGHESLACDIIDRFKKEKYIIFHQEYLEIAIEYDNERMFSTVFDLLTDDFLIRFPSNLLLPLIHNGRFNILKKLAALQTLWRFENPSILLPACLERNNIEAMRLCLNMGCDPQMENPRFKTFYLTAIKSKLLDSDSKRSLLLHAYNLADWEMISALLWPW